MYKSNLDTADDFDIFVGKVVTSWTLGTKNIEKADHRRMMLRRDSIISVEATEAN